MPSVDVRARNWAADGGLTSSCGPSEVAALLSDTEGTGGVVLAAAVAAGWAGYEGEKE